MAPYQVGFVVEADPLDVWFWVDRAIDIFFVIDMMITFARPFTDSESGEQVNNLAAVSERLQGWRLRTLSPAV